MLKQSVCKNQIPSAHALRHHRQHPHCCTQHDYCHKAVKPDAVQCKMPECRGIGSIASRPWHPPVLATSRLWPAVPTLQHRSCSSYCRKGSPPRGRRGGEGQVHGCLLGSACHNTHQTGLCFSWTFQGTDKRQLLWWKSNTECWMCG